MQADCRGNADIIYHNVTHIAALRVRHSIDVTVRSHTEYLIPKDNITVFA